jgi:hypothetical protein
MVSSLLSFRAKSRNLWGFRLNEDFKGPSAKVGMTIKHVGVKNG